MVDLCPVVKWWSENLTEKGLFMVQNVRYSNGPPSHVTLPFEYGTPILPYSDESGIQVFGIKMVTVKRVESICKKIII